MTVGVIRERGYVGRTVLGKKRDVEMIPYTPHPAAWMFDERRATGWASHPPAGGKGEAARRVRQAERTAAKQARKQARIDPRGSFL